jgi:hypothetical protein
MDSEMKRKRVAVDRDGLNASFPSPQTKLYIDAMMTLLSLKKLNERSSSIQLHVSKGE